MSDVRTTEYAKRLSRLIQVETISAKNQTDKTKFYGFHDVLREIFSNLFSICEFEDFNGSILMRWKGKTKKEPIMLMNHHAVSYTHLTLPTMAVV